jgi:hypothetical protein
MVDRPLPSSERSSQPSISGAPGLNKEAVHGGHIQNATLGFSQVRHGEFRAKKYAFEVGAYFPVPFRHGVFHGLIHLDGCIVKQHVDAPEGTQR